MPNKLIKVIYHYTGQTAVAGFSSIRTIKVSCFPPEAGQVVMLFAGSQSSTGTIKNLAAGHAPFYVIKILQLDYFPASKQIVLPTLRQCPFPILSIWTTFRHLAALYRGRACPLLNLYPDDKKHVIPVLPPGQLFG